MDYESYDVTAQDYDRTRQPIGLPILLGCFSLARQPLHETVVLDAGCGTGSYSLELADFVERVVGVDRSTAMIDQARQKAVQKGTSSARIDFMEADILELPFGDQEFDCVTVNQVLHHLGEHDADNGYPNHHRALREFHRVIRPGGVLLINLCSQEQMQKSWWYKALFAEAFDRVRQRITPVPRLVELLESEGFKHQGNYVPVDAVFQGAMYFDQAGPLKEWWRNGESVFALTTNEELRQGCARLEEMQQNGTLEDFVEQHDRQRNSVGQITFVCALKN